MNHDLDWRNVDGAHHAVGVSGTTYAIHPDSALTGAAALYIDGVLATYCDDAAAAQARAQAAESLDLLAQGNGATLSANELLQARQCAIDEVGALTGSARAGNVDPAACPTLAPLLARIESLIDDTSAGLATRNVYPLFARRPAAAAHEA